MKIFASALVLIWVILVVATSQAAHAERRVALVIGNAQYKNPSNSLANPQHDARDVAAVLKSLGFEVVLTVDADKRQFDGSLQQFARMATDADAALFYYAGHAMQYAGRNYLMPTDAELEDEISLPYQMVDLDSVRFAIDRAKGAKILILDACRNNPVADRFVRAVRGPTRNLGNVRGLARMDKSEGMVVSYATAADQVAEDGKSRNSAYTSALLTHFKWKDYRIEGRDRFKRMTLATDEFIRRFLIHVLPDGFHRIRHYGLFAKAKGAANLARARELLAVPKPQNDPTDLSHDNQSLAHPCPCCGGRLIIIRHAIGHHARRPS